MAKSGPGPRDYLAATVRALYAYSGTKCYFPDCKEPVIVFVRGEPISNVAIAHIRGAKRGSARYDPSMTNHQRRSFPNLLLLCKPHHDVVDKRHPGDYSPEVLVGWKAEREGQAGLDQAILAGLTEDRLLELIERALASVTPQRLLTVELGLGVAALELGQTISFPTETARDFFEMYANLGPVVVTLTVRSVGGLRAFVNSHELRLAPSNDRLMGINDFPRINSPLPAAVEIGESQTWLYDLGKVKDLIGRLQKLRGQVTSVAGLANLGSGETLESAELPIEALGHLPG